MSSKAAALEFESDALHRQPGSRLELQRVMDVDSSWTLDVSRVDPTKPELDLACTLESADDGIYATIETDLTIAAQCVRCLEDLDWVEPLSASTFVFYPEAAVDLDPEGDDLIVENGVINLADTFRDAVMLALPLNPVCRSDCHGLCSVCGFNLNDDPDHQHDVIDSRWDALRTLAGKSGTTKENENDGGS